MPAQGLLSRQVRLDVTGELSELTEVLVEHRMHAPHIDLQIAVHQGVAKSSERPQVMSELSRHDAERPELIDAARIIADVVARAGGEVVGDIEQVLHAELQAALDGPALRNVLLELLNVSAHVGL